MPIFWPHIIIELGGVCGLLQFILSKQINNLQSNTSSTEQEQKGPGAALLVIFTPKHSHSEQ